MELPINRHRDEILVAVKENPVTIVVGMPGSGKTTQLPVFLYKGGYGLQGKVVVTEPRRLAAISVANRVAFELGVKIGAEVGYRVRFDHRVSPQTKLCFLTDGVLLRDFRQDPLLRSCSVVMIDEAHERSQNIDLVLGLLKRALCRNHNLRVIIASATVDAQAFANYFGEAPIIDVAGRMYPVETEYTDHDIAEEAMPETTAFLARIIHQRKPPGDILVFLPGEMEIREAARHLYEAKLENAEILPVFSGLTVAEQSKIFRQYPGSRKIILATNIAETSLTIDGIKYVIDSGLVKQVTYCPEAGMDTLLTVEHSRAGCDQRSGRAGRVESGECFRLYTSDNYTRRPRFTSPEILRSNLAALVLQMSAIGIEDAEEFDFLSLPEQKLLADAYAQLTMLGALMPTTRAITQIGRAMDDLPLQPKIARMVIEGVRFSCAGDIAAIAALLSVRFPFLIPKGQRKEAKKSHAKFVNPTSDVLTLRNLRQWIKRNGISYAWCKEHFLDHHALREALEIEGQIISLLRKRGMPVLETEDEQMVMRAVVSGLSYGLLECPLPSSKSYQPVHRRLKKEIAIHQSSVISSTKTPPRWIVAMSTLETNQPYAYTCTAVQPSWLPYLAPERCSIGSPILSSYVQGETEAKACRQIIYDGVAIGIEETTLPIGVACRMQDEALAQANAQGLIPLTFQERKEAMLRVLYDEVEGVEYRPTQQAATRVKSGQTWYCRVSSNFELPQLKYVDPVFQLLDLLGQPKEAVFSSI